VTINLNRHRYRIIKSFQIIASVIQRLGWAKYIWVRKKISFLFRNSKADRKSNLFALTQYGSDVQTVVKVRELGGLPAIV